MDLYFDVIAKDKVKEMAQNTYDWIPVSSGIPASFNEKHSNPDAISQNQMDISKESNEIIPENTMDVVCD